MTIPIICTIVAKNYLAQARCLAESFLEHHPDGKIFVLLVDKIDNCFDPEQELFTTITVEELEVPEFRDMLWRYKVIELCTAVKPFFLKYLFKQYGYQKVCYFDPDIYFYQALDEEIWSPLDSYNIILTPHLLEPVDDESYPNELTMLQAGIYNLGFIGLVNNSEVDKLLNWWHKKLVKFCYMQPSKGMHVDQNWIDFVPSRFSGVYISRDWGLNVAYWDLSNRCPIPLDGKYTVNGNPLKFFHFSGYDPDKPEVISKHQNRFTFYDLPELKPLFDQYGQRLYANGHSKVKQWSNSYYPDKRELTLPGEARKEASIKNSIGINITGYIKGEFGIGEASRSIVRAVEAVDVPFALNHLAPQLQRNLDSNYENFSNENPYPINFLSINADEVQGFSLSEYGSQYFNDRYNIGYWFWELPTFPVKWRHAFSPFNEIWTASNYTAEAISKLSPIPVIKVMPSIQLPEPSIRKEAVGLPDNKFIFLFIFDFLSFFERKNPLALVQAFKKAFGEAHPDARLILKFSNAKHFAHELRLLKQEIGSSSTIHLIDRFLSRDEINALLYHCHCYVSLHRSEGFGLTMAEAMFYGKPVIGTGYSANVDFMNVSNSFLVKYNLQMLNQDYGPYEKGNVWANPDIDHASALMRQVYENYEQAQTVGAIGARDIRALLSPEAIGQTIKKRLEYITVRRLVTPSGVGSHRHDNHAASAQAWMKAAHQIQKELEQSQENVKRLTEALHQSQAIVRSPRV